MLKLKSIRQKNAPNFCKWECYTFSNEYVIIRYKNWNLDVRVSKTLDNFLTGYEVRTIYRSELDREDGNKISLNEVVELLGLDLSNIRIKEEGYEWWKL